MRKAIDYFNQAIDKDPLYALAYVGLAEAYQVLPTYLSPAGESGLKSKAAALKALEIDDTIAEAHVSLATLDENDWNWPAAEKAYRRALELNPGYAVGHQWYAQYLDRMARTKEALAEIRLAYQLDPLSPQTTVALGGILIDDRQFDAGIKQLRTALELNPQSGMASVHIIVALLSQQKFDEASVELRRAAALMPGAPVVNALQGYVYAKTGKRQAALEILRKLTAASPARHGTGFDLPALYLGLGDHDRAFEALNRARDQRAPLIELIKVDPLFEPLRSDPRYVPLLRRMRLAP